MSLHLQIPSVKPGYSQLPPQYLEAETTLLAAMLSVPDYVDFPSITKILRPFHFYRENNGIVYAAISTLVEKMEPVDLVAVANELKKVDRFEQVGAFAGLAEFTSKVTRSTEYAMTECAAMIIDNYQRREIIRSANAAMQSAYDYTINVEENLGYLLEDIERIDGAIPKGETIESQLNDLSNHSREFYESGRDVLGPEVYGIRKLDLLTDGAFGGGVTIVAGDTGSGKSALFNTIINVCTDLKMPVFNWSGEMSPRVQLSRLIAARSGINSRAIRKGRIYNEQEFPDGIKLYHRADEEIAKAGHVFSDDVMSLQSIVSTVFYHARQGIKVFLFDRKELFSTEDRNAEKGIETIMNRIRRLASQLDVHIFIAGQLRKEVDKRAGNRPTKNDIIGTSATIQAATTVLLVYRPEYYKILEDEDGNSTKGKVWLTVAKNTNGETGEVVTNFYKEISLMTDEEVEVLNGNKSNSFLKELKEPVYLGPISAEFAPDVDLDDIPFG